MNTHRSHASEFRTVGLLVWLAAAAGCALLGDRERRPPPDPAADPRIAAAVDRLVRTFEHGELPAVTNAPAGLCAALRHPQTGAAADYRLWRDYLRDYNRLLDQVHGYRSLPLLLTLADDPLRAPARLDRWVCGRAAGAPGTATALRQADALLAAFPGQAPTPPHPHPFAGPDAFAAFVSAITSSAARVTGESTTGVSARDRELMAFFAAWLCDLNAPFINRSKGAAETSICHWQGSGDLILAGSNRTARSGRPIPPELRSMTSLTRYLHALAGEPVPDAWIFCNETNGPPPAPRLTGRVDFTAYRQALADLGQVLAPEALDRLAKACAARPAVGAVNGVTGEVRACLETPYGLILVGGPGPNTYRNVRALAIVDLGGDDLYAWDQDGPPPGSQPLHLVVDLAGNDRYHAPTVGGPGVGILGLGLLLDRQGNDLYLQGLSPSGMALAAPGLVQPDPDGTNTCWVPYAALWGNPAHPDQPGVALDAGFAFGAGLLGVGIVVDEAGDDCYLGQKYAFGAGFWRGVGVLHDGAGRDVYAAGIASIGCGINGACGWLDDRAGNDHYQCLGMVESSYSAGQAWDNGYDGFGLGSGYSWRAEARQTPHRPSPTLGGGIGAVHDGGGDDTYLAGSFGCAAGYAGGLGLIADDAGNDTYFVKRGPKGDNHNGWSGNHALANGCHRGLGFLVDRAGNDRYSASSLGGATGWDLGCGYLCDLGGDDDHTDLHGVSQQGSLGWAAAQAFALFLDGGGTDRYRRNSCGDAGTYNPSYPGVGGNFAAFFDLGPEPDAYPKPWNDQLRYGPVGLDAKDTPTANPAGAAVCIDGSAW